MGYEAPERYFINHPLPSLGFQEGRADRLVSNFFFRFLTNHESESLEKYTRQVTKWTKALSIAHIGKLGKQLP